LAVEKVQPPLTANERLIDRAVRHAVYLERLKTGEARRIIAFLNSQLFPDIARILRARLALIDERGIDTGPFTTERLRALATDIEVAASVRLGDIRDRQFTAFDQLGETEVAFAVKTMTQSLPFAFSFAGVDYPILRAAIRERPLQGRILGEWYGDLSKSLRSRIEQQIRIGVAQSETIDQLVRRLVGTRAAQYTDGVFETTRREARSLVRTAVNHISSQSRELVYEENSDFVSGVLIVATLDTRTTEICMAQDGRVYPINEGWRPPGHFNCRTTTTPVLRGWKAFGLSDPPASTRASMNGQVPETLTYGPWLRRQSAGVQDEALGPTRAALFRSGKVEIDRFVGADDRTLNLNELRQREGLTVADIEKAMKRG
jgi:SPP1 gp7 family putative phage head morphogenesis protein